MKYFEIVQDHTHSKKSYESYAKLYKMFFKLHNMNSSYINLELYTYIHIIYTFPNLRSNMPGGKTWEKQT